MKAARKYNPGFIEMRIDYLKEDLASKVATQGNLKTVNGKEILTLRTRTRGGKFSGNESLRLELIQSFVEEYIPKFVDIELSSLPGQ